MLTGYLCLLLAIPSSMVVGALGSAGAPSAILAVGAFFLWLWFLIQRTGQYRRESSPVRTAGLIWLLIMLVVYAHAMATPLPADEISPADNGMLKLVGLVGILLVANDGITSLDRYRVFTRRLVIGGGLVAALGLLQYATKDLFIDRISIPGLTSSGGGAELAVRSGLTRPSGTSTHPIEYGVVLTMILPFAVVYAMRAQRHRWVYRGVLVVMGMTILLSISRSAMLCAAVGLLVLSVTWSSAAKLRALVVLLGILATVYLTVPGVLGTITSLFTGVSEDPSIASRTGSYDIAYSFFLNSPVVGRGFGTFLPKYWILDNGYLGLLIEGGIVGLLGLLALIATAAFSAQKARRSVSDEFDRALAQAVLASVCSGSISLAFFDTFAFPQSAGCFFLVLGLAGALLRLVTTENEVAVTGASLDMV